MANVLIEESTLTAIGDAIRSKTGKTDLILPSDMATEIDGITGGGKEVLVEVLKEKTYTGFQNNKLELESDIDFESEINLVAGEKYVVVWDGVEHRLTAIEGLTNCIDLALSEFTEGDFPFYIGYLYDYNEEGHDVLEIYTKDDEISHTFGIHKVTDGVSYKTVVFGKQNVEGFTLNSSLGVYNSHKLPAWFTLEVGETYLVNWEGEEHKCVGQFIDMVDYTAVCIGNCSEVGGTGNNEQFIIAYVEAHNMNIFFSFTNESEHNVAIYKEIKVDVPHELVKYVTFMSWDGKQELYKKPTIVGDDCVNVVSKGFISKPTRESTNTTNYTYSGWSLTSGGSADSNALKNVTEDRVVYASFAESVRYYTVRFYTEVGVLHETVQVTYGGTATPSAIPEKQGFGFDGWSPNNENITEDTNCYAIWTEKISFANASWADIARISESGEAPTTFAVGDTKTFSMTIADGTTQEVTFAIAGFGIDTLSNGNGKAGITIMQLGTMNDLVVQDDIGIFTAEETKYLHLLPTALSSVIKSVNKMFEGSTVSGKIWALDANEFLDNYTTTTYVDKFDTTASVFPIFEGKTQTERIDMICDGRNSMLRSKRMSGIPKCRGLLKATNNNSIPISRMYDSGLSTAYYHLCFCI